MSTKERILKLLGITPKKVNVVIHIYRYTDKRYIAEKESINYCRTYKFTTINYTGTTPVNYINNLVEQWKSDTSFAYLVVFGKSKTFFVDKDNML